MFIDNNEQNKRQLSLLLNRVGRVSEILYEKQPSLLPFKDKFPLIDIIEQSAFLNECSKYLYFDDLPSNYKEKIYKAEKIKFFDKKFLNYLDLNNISKKEFKNKNPKTKMDIFYNFLFSNKMDDGILYL